jgi:hypothetical protein
LIQIKTLPKTKTSSMPLAPPLESTAQRPAQIYFQQGKQRRRQGNLAAAIRCFQESIRFQADFVSPYRLSSDFRTHAAASITDLIHYR